MATPENTGESKESWGYKIEQVSKDKYTISWYNTHVTDSGFPIVLLIQYGHAVGTSYIVGKDFINPAMKPTFDKIASEIGKEVMGI